MEKPKSFSAFRWILQGMLLSVSLVAVIVSIRALRDPGQKLSLGTIFESREALWDWCPTGRELTVELLPGGAPISASDVCEIKTLTVETGEVQVATWKPLLKARSESGTEIILEGDVDLGIFRAQGLPFKSLDLQEQLKELSSP